MLSTVPHIETSFRVIIFRSWERIKQLDCLIYLYLCLRNWRSMTSFYGRAGGIWWLLDGASLSCALPDKMAKEETRFDIIGWCDRAESGWNYAVMAFCGLKSHFFVLRLDKLQQIVIQQVN